jgi:hypothetical protein
MILNRVPLAIIADIVGWSAGTTVKMAIRYGHYTLEEKRAAMKFKPNSGPPNREISEGYPQKSPKSEPPSGGAVQ